MPVGSSAAAAVLAAAQAVSFATRDGWTIAAKYRPAASGKAVVVLAHGVGSAGDEWNGLAEDLARRGIGTLALDLRGHAGSLSGPPGSTGWAGFDASGAWAGSAEDLRAAAAWLNKKGVPDWRVAFGGASIGANLASEVAVERKSAPFVLMLSPAENYRGVPMRFRPGLPALVAAAPEDGYAYVAARRAEAERTALVHYAPSGHGARMLADAATRERVVDWIAKAKLAPPKTPAPAKKR